VAIEKLLKSRPQVNDARTQGAAKMNLCIHLEKPNP
jgi:hypothetical protein